MFLGLCGDFNGDENNELQFATVNEFGNSFTAGGLQTE